MSIQVKWKQKQTNTWKRWRWDELVTCPGCKLPSPSTAAIGFSRPQQPWEEDWVGLEHGWRGGLGSECSKLLTLTDKKGNSGFWHHLPSDTGSHHLIINILQDTFNIWFSQDTHPSDTDLVPHTRTCSTHSHEQWSATEEGEVVCSLIFFHFSGFSLTVVSGHANSRLDC